MRFILNLVSRQVAMPLLSSVSPRSASRRDTEARPRQINHSPSSATDTTRNETQPAVSSQVLQRAFSADLHYHLLQLHAIILNSSWDPVAAPSRALTTRLPLSRSYPAPAVYFDRITHRIHVPCPVVAVFKVSEGISTIYFTLTDRLPAHAVPTSRVIYPHAAHNSMVGLDFLLPTRDNVRPLTREAYDVFRALTQLNTRIFRHMIRQHLFMHYARFYSAIRLYDQRRARIRTPDPQATTTIPGIPYFEEYMFHYAKPQAWMCKDITEIFNLPDLKLSFVA
ncbi:uncharacterized protein SCHCODRAFT_02752916 [Schizophyllum commune H4-8]|nr:uncharacterized protein SCHCODRAFT_02752916 [Schizophyllum commune H4-8]KAI5886429.1 hypothetical protein SCHCODRAFT_02752916 [Schizophyllum commune H4-8]